MQTGKVNTKKRKKDIFGLKTVIAIYNCNQTAIKQQMQRELEVEKLRRYGMVSIKQQYKPTAGRLFQEYFFSIFPPVNF